MAVVTGSTELRGGSGTISLRACYAMSVYAAISLRMMSGTDLQHLVLSFYALATQCPAISLCMCYAKSGTDQASGTRHGEHDSRTGEPRYPPTRLLCDVRYWDRRWV
eukprot:926392-Rhodomonas_salina.2